MIRFSPDFADFLWWHWAGFFTLSAFTMALAITPTTFIAILCGFFLGYNGLIPVVIAYQVASVIGYFLAKAANKGFLSQVLAAYPKAEGYFQRVDKNDLKITLLARISPALPFAIMNSVLSLARIRFSRFFLGGLIGMLPRTLFFIWVGTNAKYLVDVIAQKQELIWILAISLPIFWLMWKMIKPNPNNSGDS